ncbi:MAG: DUF418 domain-containing protein [Anaerolinea sp.]|nr:DUF418 domain-containing protein [Anaerolinea sp.]
MNSTEVSPTPIMPVQQAERIQIVDILRGFALFGILLVNMALFSHPFQHLLFPMDPALAWYDRAAVWLIHFLGEGKFYALFSMLFGLGLTLLMDRVEARGGRFVPLYLRRLLILLVIGVIHAFLIWMGDILILYALLGFLLILFRKAKPRTLLIWAVILIALPLLFNVVVTGLVELGRSSPEGAVQIDAAFAEAEAGFVTDLERANHVYSSGNFLEITAQRIYDYTSMGLSAFFVMGFNVLGMFLIGVYFGKREIFKNLEANRNFFRKLLFWGLLIGLAGNALYATLIISLPRVELSGPLLLATVAQGVGAPLLTLAYVSAFCLLALSPVWGERLKVLAPVGQMALTNYLTQSTVCTLIFYNYGLGFFGKMGAALGIGLTVAIYLLQIPFSHWWMKRFRYGPAEWLWRSLTYGKRQPLKRV